MIHNLGTELLPGDESSNRRAAAGDEPPIEPLPIVALRSPSGCSTRLFRLPVILASTSPIRRHMLEAAGVDREVRGLENASDHAPVWIELRV